MVSTQGHALTVDDLASTLVVEATLHHLDLVRHLPGAPTAQERGDLGGVVVPVFT